MLNVFASLPIVKSLKRLMGAPFSNLLIISLFTLDVCDSSTCVIPFDPRSLANFELFNLSPSLLINV